MNTRIHLQKVAKENGVAADWRSSIFSLALVALLASVGPTYGQDGGSSSTGSASHPFIHGLGTGDSSAPDTEVFDLRIPVGYTLIPLEEDRPWGLRLRMEVFASIYDFTPDIDTDFDYRFSGVTAAPGVEFLVPVGKGWVLKPFAEIGYARDFDNDLGLGVWSFGMRTLVTWPVKKIDLSFGTKMQYLNTWTSDFALVDEFGEVRLGLDARYPLWFTIGGNQAYGSLYFIHRHYFNARVELPEDDPLEISYTDEIGVALGTDPRIKLWFFKLPRIGLGFRWGENLRGVRLNFGFPF